MQSKLIEKWSYVLWVQQIISISVSLNCLILEKLHKPWIDWNF